MLVHIVLGSVPGRIQTRNRFGFVRLFERCRTPGPRYVATPTAGSDHEERFTEMAHACQDCKLTTRVTRCSAGVVLALCGWSIVALATTTTIAQHAETRFGGAYSGLGDRRQQLIDNWVARFVKTTGQQVEAGPFPQDSDDPSTFDRGPTPFQLMINLKSAHDSLGPQRSLDGLVVGTCIACHLAASSRAVRPLFGLGRRGGVV
jgi:hypothetical protein